MSAVSGKMGIFPEAWSRGLLTVLLVGLCTASTAPIQLSKDQISLCKTGAPGLRSLAEQLKVLCCC